MTDSRGAGPRIRLLFAAVAGIQAVACTPAAAQPADPPTLPFQAEWRSLQNEFGEMHRFKPNGAGAVPVQQLMAWARDQKATTIFDWGCRRIRVTKEDGEFRGKTDVREEIEADGLTKYISHDDASFGASIQVFQGGTTHYQRSKNGRWLETGGSGYGIVVFSSRLLSKVTADAAWYGSAAVALSLVCKEKTNEVMSCEEGGSRTCSRCSKWGFHPTYLSGPLLGWGFKMGEVTVHSATTADCASPCVPDETPANVSKANALLKGRAFIVEVHLDHPLIFRTHEACRRYRRVNRIPSSDSNAW